jgi:hypothetical protein
MYWEKETGLDTKDCPLAWDNQIWRSGKQISMQSWPTDNHSFAFFVYIADKWLKKLKS